MRLRKPRTIIYSLSSGHALLQFFQIHVEHMTEQSRPALQQEHRFPPVLHPRDTIFNTESDAEPFLHSKVGPICMIFAAAVVGGKL